jgi:hypothetical protein
MRRLSPPQILLAAFVVAIALIVMVAIINDSSDDWFQKDEPTVIQVDGIDEDDKADDPIVLSPPAEELLERVEADPEARDFGPELRDDPGPPVAGTLTGPLAAEEWPGCRTAFVKAFSQRTAPIRAIGLHYTVSGNLAGWADINGLTAFSNNLQNQASWHFLIDQEGNCAYSVPIRYKAWTIGNLNSQTINFEIVARGSEPQYLEPAAARRLKAVVTRISEIWNIPIRVGAVDGACNVTKTGIITHWQGGSCAGAHNDIRPYDLAQVVALLSGPVSVDRAKNIERCKDIRRWRADGRPAEREKWIDPKIQKMRRDGWRCYQDKPHLRKGSQ